VKSLSLNKGALIGPKNKIGGWEQTHKSVTWDLYKREEGRKTRDSRIRKQHPSSSHEKKEGPDLKTLSRGREPAGKNGDPGGSGAATLKRGRKLR